MKQPTYTRDAGQYLAQTKHCKELPNGDMIVRNGPNSLTIGPEIIRTPKLFGMVWLDLRDEDWFSPRVAADFANIVAHRLADTPDQKA